MSVVVWVQFNSINRHRSSSSSSKCSKCLLLSTPATPATAACRTTDASMLMWLWDWKWVWQKFIMLYYFEETSEFLWSYFEVTLKSCLNKSSNFFWRNFSRETNYRETLKKVRFFLLRIFNNFSGTVKVYWIKLSFCTYTINFFTSIVLVFQTT